MRRAGATVGPSLSIQGQQPRLSVDGRLEIGSGLAISGRQFPVLLAVERGGELIIGDETFLNQGTVIHASTSIRIGARVRTADLVAIYDTNFHEVDEGAGVKMAPVVIGDNVWLGRCVTVLPGVTIGDHTVVAAGSVVSRDLRGCVLAGGVPATIMREITCSDDFHRR